MVFGQSTYRGCAIDTDRMRAFFVLSISCAFAQITLCLAWRGYLSVSKRRERFT